MQNDEKLASQMKNVKVYVRILPLLERCENCAKIGNDKKTIYVRCLQDLRKSKKRESKNPLFWSFVTNGIFYFSSQEEIYNETTNDIINNVLDGANFVLISCGQTGTGKSFTVGGLRNNWEHRGIVPRLIAELMIEKRRRKRTNRIKYSLSYVEFRGKKIKDLLKHTDKFFDVNNNKDDVFKNISKPIVKDEKDALQYIFQGEGRRALAEISEYPVCHLGTSVITFHVHNTSLITSWAIVAEATIHIVEMAGIDNTGKSSCLKSSPDVISANSMKSELEQYFDNLTTMDRISSPSSRSSCFLKYMGDTLSFNSIIRFIAHVKVKKDNLDVTLSTLRFVGKMAKIPISKVTYNIKPQNTMFIEKLQNEIERLKKELYINEMFFHQEAIMNMSSKRAQQIQRDFLDFLNGRISDVELVSFSQMEILTKIIKDLYVKFLKEKENAQKDSEKSETALKSTSRIISKTSLQGPGQNTGLKNSNAKDLRSSVEISEGSKTDGVGSLENHGITLGPGIAQIPAMSAAVASKLVDKNKSINIVSCEKQSIENFNATNEESYERFLDNMQKTFERLQESLKRLMQGEGSSRKNHSIVSTTIMRARRCNNEK